MLSLFCRVIGLKKAIDFKKIKKVFIFDSYNNVWNKDSHLNRFISPYRYLANNGFFGDAKIEIQTESVKSFIEYNKTITNSIILRVLVTKLRYTILWLISKFFLLLPKSKKIIILGDSEIIRETNYFLLASGVITLVNKKKKYKKK